MAIINGQIGNADEVMNAFGSNFNDTAQNLFNADYLGFDSRLANSGTPNLKNVFYSTFTSDDADTNIGFEYDALNDLYYSGVIDQASGDTTHDPNSFSNPENAFDDNDLTFAQEISTSTGGISVRLGKTFSSKLVNIVRIIATNTGVGSTKTIVLETFNGSIWSNVSTLASGVGTGDISFDGTFELNATTQGVRVGLTDAGSSGGNKTYKLFTLEYGDSVSSCSLTIKETTTDTVTNAIPIFNVNINSDAVITISVSADGGSNFTEVNNTEIARPTEGTELWWKIELNKTDLTKIDRVTEQAVKYNLY